MMTPAPTDWTCPSHWPTGHDGEWRLLALANAAAKLSAKAPDLFVSLHSPSPPCLRLDVFRLANRVAVVFANRNRLSKQSPIYTLYTGAREEHNRYHSVLRLAHFVARANEPLPAGEERHLLLPELLEYLQPLAEKDHQVSSGMDRDSFIAQLLASEVEDYVCLYRMIVENQDLQRINDWLESNYPSPTYGKVFNLLLALDGLAQSGRVPADLAATHLIEWDTREYDDHGNEW